MIWDIVKLNLTMSQVVFRGSIFVDFLKLNSEKEVMTYGMIYPQYQQSF